MKNQIDHMFEGGFIFKNPDGSLSVSQTEEQRAFAAQSAAKQPRVPNQLNVMAAQSAVRNLNGQFAEALVEADDIGDY